MPTKRLALATNSHLKMKKILCAVSLAIGMNVCFAGLTQIYYSKIDCGNWLNEPNEQFLRKSWLLGYLTSMNSMLIGSKANQQGDYLKGIDGQQIFVWMDNYCRRNPLETIDKGVPELMNELVRKSK